MKFRVGFKELVVHGAGFGVRGVGLFRRLHEDFRRVEDVVLAAPFAACGQGAEDRRAEGAAVFRAGHGDRALRHVGEDLHEQRVFAAHAAGGKDVFGFDARFVEGLEDHPGAVGDGFDEGPVHFFGFRGQAHAHHEAGEVVVHEDRAVAVPPVEGEEPRFTRL